MPSPTYMLIAKTTVGTGGAAYIEFAGIPNTYTDLKMIWSARHTADLADQYLRFNGDSSSVYSMKLVRALDGNTVGSEGNTGQSSDTRAGYNQKSSYTGSMFSNCELYIPSYAGSNNKSYSIDSCAGNNSSAAYLLQLHSGLWASSSAITSIRITPETGNYAEHSTAFLYGIKNS